MDKTSLIFSDTPIQQVSQDEFGRASMAELIANSIIELSKADHKCTNIGIYGTWGSGKTSLINLVQNLLVANGKNDNISIAHFNPWQAGSDELLMGEFFKSVYRDFEGDVRYFIKKYGAVVSFAAQSIPVIGGALSAGINTAKEALASSENTIKEQKERISKAIVDSGKHLLVFVDDLDRLDKEELHTVFRLIRQVADFDNTIYVVAMDVDMASKSIAQYYGGSSVEDGRRFIDKIIQVPISLPTIQKSFLKNYLTKSFHNIFDTHIQFESQEVDSMAETIANLFVTKRDCIRYVNQLGFVFPAIANEVNTYDFCILEAIKTMSQEAYLKVLHNKNALLRTRDEVGFPFMEDKEVEKQLEERFQKALDDIVDGLNSHNVGNNFKKILEHNLFNHNTTDPFVLIDKQRLQSSIYFDKYFVLAVPENLIPDVEMDALHSKLLSMNYRDLSGWIDEKYARYGYDEIQRAVLRVVRKFDEDSRCKSTQLFCRALSVSELAKGYSGNLYNPKRVDMFVTGTLLPYYMVRYQDSDTGQYEVDAEMLDDTLSIIYQQAELNYCMLIHYGANKIPVAVMNKTTKSFEVLRDRFVALAFDEQMKLHKELLTAFYAFWKRTDADGMAEYLTNLIRNDGFKSEDFVNKFIVFDGDATVIDSFVNLFKDVILVLVDKINQEGVDYSKDSPVKLLMANYRAMLGVD